MEFKYAPMFQLGKDETEYYLLTKDHVSVSEFEGKPILKIEAEGLTKMANAAFSDVSFMLRRSHNEQVAKIAQQIVKSAHPDSVLSYLNQRVNTDSVMYVKIERGLWLPGKSAAVDKYGFKTKGAEYTASEEFPFVVALGKVIKAPKEYSDERGKVTTDYQDYLEKQWIASLKEKYPVVVNQAVLEQLK